MIGKFIASLSGTGKMLLVLAVAFSVIALSDLLFFSQTMAKMSVIDQEIVTEKNAIKQDLRFLNYKNKILKEGKIFDPYLSQSSVTEDEVIAAFLKKIDLMKVKANVVMIKVTPSPGIDEKGSIKYQADLEFTGKLADVITFMYLFNSSDELIKVVKFSFSSKKIDIDEIRASITVAKLVVGKHAASFTKSKQMLPTTPASSAKQ